MARVVLMAEALVEVHIHPDRRIEVQGLKEALLARRELLGEAKGPLLFYAFGDLDWEPAALQTDIFGADTPSITAMGVLVSNKVLALAANMYFGLFPAPFPTKIDNDVEGMRIWLASNG